MLWKKLTFVLFLYVAFELSSLAGLYLIKQQIRISYYPADTLSAKHRSKLENWIAQSSNYLRHDQELGWTIRANGTEGLYHANSAGIRSDSEVSTAKTSLLRVACFGDSFTHGDSVSNSQTWPATATALSQNQSIEFLNFGISGYGIDQSFLRYQKLGIQYGADIALIGFMSRDLYEPQNRMRSLQLRNTGMPFGKPRFIRESKTSNELRRLPNPLPDLAAYKALLDNPKVELSRIGKDDFYFENGYKTSGLSIFPSIRLVQVLKASYAQKVKHFGGIKDGVFDSESEHFQLSAAILEKFASSIEENGTTPIVLFLPNKEDITRHRSGLATSYSPLKQHLKEKNIATLDAVEAFKSPKLEIHLLISGHYTAAGSRQIAAWLVGKMETLNTQPLKAEAHATE